MPETIKRRAAAAEATLRRERSGMLDEIHALPGVEFAELVPGGVFFKVRLFSAHGTVRVDQIRSIAGGQLS